MQVSNDVHLSGLFDYDILRLQQWPDNNRLIVQPNACRSHFYVILIHCYVQPGQARPFKNLANVQNTLDIGVTCCMLNLPKISSFVDDNNV